VQVLVVNSGSSSLKLSVIGDQEKLVAGRDLPPLRDDDLRSALLSILEDVPDIEAVGHRVVNGGSRFVEPVQIDRDVVGFLEELNGLAPLHNPRSVAAIEAMHALRPSLPQYACFDTAFHATMPAAAFTYAIPEQWRELGFRRLGFHGLSHAYASRRSAELLGVDPRGLRLVTAHIGSGASVAAVDSGRSVDTSMGFTPIDGLVMSTRSGSVDPGMLLWLQRNLFLSPDSVEEALEKRSGLLGLSGISGDLRVVLAEADNGDGRAELAYAVYIHRLRQTVAAMVASLGGFDALVFTGGAGEGSHRLRSDTVSGLEFLGLKIDETVEGLSSGDRSVSKPGLSPAVLVVHAREDLEIYRHVLEMWGAASKGANSQDAR
jgi:acetate kinase